MRRILPLIALCLALATPVVWASWPAGGLYPPPRGPCPTSVWNSADKSATVTLDACAVTASDTSGGSGIIGVRSTNFQSTGKYYWEQTAHSIVDGNNSIGFEDTTPPLTDFLGQSSTSWGYYPHSGAVWNSNTVYGTLATTSLNLRVDVAVDLDKQHCWFRANGGNWNNDASGNPATDAIPVYCNRFANLYAATSLGINNTATTANFNPAAANVPSGFTAGIPAGGTAYVAGHTWSPLDMARKLTVSNGRLTASGNGAGYSGLRSALSVSSGKYYWEIAATSITSNSTGFGIADATQDLTTYLGSSGNHSVGWFSTGDVYINNANTGSISTYANGDTLSVALDMTNSKIWFRKNCGNWNNAAIGSQDPASNIGGRSISALTGPFYAAANSGAAIDVWTANFGATAFGCTAPTGFSSGP